MRLLKDLSNKALIPVGNEEFILENQGRYLHCVASLPHEGSKMVVGKAKGVAILEAKHIDKGNNMIVADDNFPYDSRICFRLLSTMSKKEFETDYSHQIN